MKPPSRIAVFTRRNPEKTVDAVHRLAELAVEAGVELLVPSEEVDKHGLEDLPGATFDADPLTADLALVFGGDGTILTTMRRFAGRGVPVFAVNFGAIGFLSTVERADLDDALRRALSGRYEVLSLPTLTAGASVGDRVAVNDISFHRRQDLRVAELGFSVQGQELGHGALRRAGGLHPRGLHGLQPGQRRPGAGLGRGGLRGVVHRAPHAHRPGAGGGARRRAARCPTARPTTRWT